MLFFNAPALHTEMFCLKNACGSKGLDEFHNSIDDLFTNSFLNLKSSGIDIQNPGQFGYSHYSLVGDIGYMAPAAKKSMWCSQQLKNSIFFKRTMP